MKVHRSFGVQIAVIRSINLDSWTDKQKKLMELGGNKRAFNYFEKNKLFEITVKSRYSNPVAMQYKKMLEKEACNQLGIKFEEDDFNQKSKSEFEQKFEGRTSISSDDFVENKKNGGGLCDCCENCTIL